MREIIDRQEQIVSIVKESGFAAVKELAEQMSATPKTIRVLSSDLEKQGDVIRVHGGLLYRPDDLNAEKNEDCFQNPGRKEDPGMILAEKAAEMIGDENCVFLDQGSISLKLFSILIKKRIKIVASFQPDLSLPADIQAEVYLTGGRYESGTWTSAGLFSLELLSRFNFDLAFFDCDGFDLKTRDVFVGDEKHSLIRKQVMKQAEKTVLLADPASAGCRGFIRFGKLNDYDAVISNPNPDWPEENLPENFILSSKNSREAPEAGSMD